MIYEMGFIESVTKNRMCVSLMYIECEIHNVFSLSITAYCTLKQSWQKEQLAESIIFYRKGEQI